MHKSQLYLLWLSTSVYIYAVKTPVGILDVATMLGRSIFSFPASLSTSTPKQVTV